MSYNNNEFFSNYLPEYLTDKEKYTVLKRISDAYPNIDYYASNKDDGIWQGDCWNSLDIYNIDGRKEVLGIILSNTCDISLDNKRILPAKLVFAPIVKVRSYQQTLHSNCRDTNKMDNHLEAVKQHLEAVKRQEVTNRFYLPQPNYVDSDFVALLDDVHTITLSQFSEKNNKKLHIRLSQEGFYLFLIKLSIHFCRVFEELARK